jgi:hypothetical protein
VSPLLAELRCTRYDTEHERRVEPVDGCCEQLAERAGLRYEHDLSAEFVDACVDVARADVIGHVVADRRGGELSSRRSGHGRVHPALKRCRLAPTTDR